MFKLRINFLGQTKLFLEYFDTAKEAYEMLDKYTKSGLVIGWGVYDETKKSIPGKNLRIIQ